MPQMTGIELAERLRARLPTLRWLLCTGFADEASIARARALGALAVLHKPVEPIKLRTAIESALQTADDQLDGGLTSQHAPELSVTRLRRSGHTND